MAMTDKGCVGFSFDQGGVNKILLILKAPVTTAADDIHKYLFIVFQRK